MLLPIPSPAPGVVINNDTSTASVRYPVFAAITNGQAVKEYVSSSKFYYVPSTGVLNATSFAGAGTGLTGTAASLSIGGNAATATLATAATNLAGGVANNMAYQTGAGATAFITAPSTSGSYLQWTSVGGFAWTPFSGVTSFSAGTTGFTPNVSTTGAITLAGTLGAANGGTGATTLTGYVYGNGVGAMTASATIPNTAISGLGSMSTQNASSVAITGGTINGTSIGATTRASGDFTTLSTNTVTSITPVLSFNASNSIAVFGSTTGNSYNQLVIQNKSTSAGASTNYVVSNDLGTDSTYYAEFGMNSSIYSSGVPSDFFSINNGIYFSGHDGDISVGSGNGFKTYLAWGTTGQSAHVINASGAIGLSTNLGTTPALSGTTGYGTSGYLMQTGGSAASPSWVNPASLSVASATSLVGGNSGYVPYQSAINTTAFVSAGTVGQVFTSGGTGTPTWTSQSALVVGTATNIAGGSANQIHYQSSAGVTTFITAPTVSSTFLQWNGTAFVWATVSAIGINAVTGTAPITVTTTSGTANVSLASGYGDTQNPYASKTANIFLAAPNGSAGVPTFRAIVSADIPTLNQNTTGSSASCTGNSATATNVAGSGITGSRGIPKAAMPAGTVLQIISSNSTSTTSTTSASMVATGYAATITPTSSTSTILVLVNVGAVSANQTASLCIARGSTLLGRSASGTGVNGGSVDTINAAGSTYSMSLSYQDSPGTTSATTYNLYFASDSGTVAINKRIADSYIGGSTTITLIEVAA
jgi:hypothetical protein